MQLALCHYSLRRTWAQHDWRPLELATRVKELGVPAVDFHTRWVGDIPAKEIRQAVDASGLTLSGLSFSNNFLLDDADALEAELRKVEGWIDLAGAVGAPVSRIFGGSLPRELRHDGSARENRLDRLIVPLQRVSARAADAGLVLAIENHGGLPGTSSEVIRIIEAVGSQALRATVDTGNFLQAGQAPEDGARDLARYAAYVHVKDFHKRPDAGAPLGYTLEAAVVGDGDVDNAGCLAALRAAGYDGTVALEYEGAAAEDEAVPASIAHLRGLLGT